MDSHRRQPSATAIGHGQSGRGGGGGPLRDDLSRPFASTVAIRAAIRYRRLMIRAAVLCALFTMVACGSDGTGGEGTGGAAGGGAGGTSASGGGGSGGSGAVPPADGPFACGSSTCTATQFCIHPCCGGAPPMCQPKPEGGACPAGFHDGCPGGCSDPNGCCEMDPCKPAPPYCADAPEAGCTLQGHDCHMQCA